MDERGRACLEAAVEEIGANTVAVLRLRSVVAEDGVLERLRERGRTIYAPQ